MTDACLTVEQVARYVGESVTPSTRADLAAHVERCDACRATVAAAIKAARRSEPPPADDVLATGARVGRFLVIELVGAGGAGRVYAAYDPQLDRRIALKLVREPDGGPDVLARLQREAQLAARLQHPNVVAVYDAGGFGDQVFVAMELVAGETLRGWLAAAPRGWREVVAMFRQVGEGLAAAHAAGLVHRDVKPDNVLIGRDGRARVGDFGLARQAGPAPGEAIAPAPDAAVGTDSQAPTIGGRLTRTGAVLGTPAYMAPEQLRGEDADARADQFGFCVALHEGLYGERPFGGATVAERLRAIEAGAIRTPAHARVPRRVREVVVRGLAADPGARYPSMPALLDALARAARGRRALAIGAAIAAIAAGGVALAIATRGAAPPACDDGAAAIADAWSAPRRAALEQAFRASRRPFAGQAIAQVEALFDRYAARWRAIHLDACTATFVRHEQSAELLDRRTLCLEERRAALAAQAAVFASADGAIVDRAVRLAEDLPSLDACDDRAALLAPVALPPELARRAQVQVLRGRIAAAAVDERSARFAPARAAIDGLRAPVAAVAYAPLTAMLDELDGTTAEDTHDTQRAIAAFDRAALEAETGGDDLVKARALIGGARVRGLANLEPAVVTRLFDQAKATLARVGGSADVEVRMELAEGGIALVQGRFADVVPHDRAALAAAERAYGKDDVRTASARGELANALERVGGYDEAGTLAADALAVLEPTLGAAHPRTVAVRAIAGQILYDQARYDDALAAQQQVLAARQAVFGADDPSTWNAVSDLARTYEAKTDFATALTLYLRARDLVDRAVGPEHPNAVLVRVNVASAYLELGRSDDAVAAFRDAIARSIRAVGADNIFAANAHNGIAQAWLASHPDEALVSAREALRLFRALEGDEHPDVGRGYDTLGRVLDRLGRRAEALAAIEQAVAIRAKALGADHPDTADSRFTLASLLDRSGERARAIDEARAARRALVAAGDTVNTRTVDAWLAKRGAAPSP